MSRLPGCQLTSDWKPPDFPDAAVSEPGLPYQRAFHLFNHGPRIHDILQELYADVMSSMSATLLYLQSILSEIDREPEYDAFTVGEAAFTSPEEATKYVRQDRADREMQSKNKKIW